MYGFVSIKFWNAAATPWLILGNIFKLRVPVVAITCNWPLGKCTITIITIIFITFTIIIFIIITVIGIGASVCDEWFPCLSPSKSLSLRLILGDKAADLLRQEVMLWAHRKPLSAVAALLSCNTQPVGSSQTISSSRSNFLQQPISTEQQQQQRSHELEKCGRGCGPLSESVASKGVEPSSGSWQTDRRQDLCRPFLRSGKGP